MDFLKLLFPKVGYGRVIIEADFSRLYLENNMFNDFIVSTQTQTQNLILETQINTGNQEIQIQALMIVLN